MFAIDNSLEAAVTQSAPQTGGSGWDAGFANTQAAAPAGSGSHGIDTLLSSAAPAQTAAAGVTGANPFDLGELTDNLNEFEAIIAEGEMAVYTSALDHAIAFINSMQHPAVPAASAAQGTVAVSSTDVSHANPFDSTSSMTTPVVVDGKTNENPFGQGEMTDAVWTLQFEEAKGDLQVYTDAFAHAMGWVNAQNHAA